MLNREHKRIYDSISISIFCLVRLCMDRPYIAYPEEGECLFHSQIWVKGTTPHFIVNNGSQKNLIST
jgi:hypothetical protein